MCQVPADVQRNLGRLSQQIQVRQVVARQPGVLHTNSLKDGIVNYVES